MNMDLAEITETIYTSEDAATLTEELKSDGTALWWKFSEALQGGVHIALGYAPGKEGATQYLHDHFPEGPVTPPREKQLEAVEMFGTSMSNRALATLTGLSEGTIRNRKKELAEISGAKNYAPEEATVTGWDGKQYPASRPAKPQQQEEDRQVVEAEIVFDDEPAPVSQDQGQPTTDAASLPDHGLTPIKALDDWDDSAPKVNADSARDAISNLIHKPHQGLTPVQQQARHLSTSLSVEIISAETWSERELSDVAYESAQTINVLSILLVRMAKAPSAGALSRRALIKDDTFNKLREAEQTIQAIRTFIQEEATRR